MSSLEIAFSSSGLTYIQQSKVGAVARLVFSTYIAIQIPYNCGQSDCFKTGKIRPKHIYKKGSIETSNIYTMCKNNALLMNRYFFSVNVLYLVFTEVHC